jgi:hypothetical protein
MYIHWVVILCLNNFSCKLEPAQVMQVGPAQVLQVGPAQDVLPTRIHRGNMVINGKAWRQFKETHPE